MISGTIKKLLIAAIFVMVCSVGAYAANDKVTVYTAAPQVYLDELLPLFTKETGLEVEIVKAGSGELINRLKAEAGKSSADVIWSVGGELLEFNKNLLVPFEPENLSAISEAYKTDGSWLPFAAIMNVFIVNTDKVSEADIPKSWMDLTDAKYKGMISSARADKSGSAYMQLVTVLQVFGEEKGWEAYNSLLNNYALSGSSGAVPRFVNDGEALVGITLEDNAYKYVKGGGPVTIVYPEEGTSSIADGMALVKGGKNLDGGKLFINWMLSKEAQTVITAQGRRSVRGDVKALGNLPALSEVKLIDYDLKYAATNRPAFKNKWNELLLNR